MLVYFCHRGRYDESLRRASVRKRILGDCRHSVGKFQRIERIGSEENTLYIITRLTAGCDVVCRTFIQNQRIALVALFKDDVCEVGAADKDVYLHTAHRVGYGEGDKRSAVVEQTRLHGFESCGQSDCGKLLAAAERVRTYFQITQYALRELDFRYVFVVFERACGNIFYRVGNVNHAVLAACADGAVKQVGQSALLTAFLQCVAVNYAVNRRVFFVAISYINFAYVVAVEEGIGQRSVVVDCNGRQRRGEADFKQLLAVGKHLFPYFFYALFKDCVLETRTGGEHLVAQSLYVAGDGNCRQRRAFLERAAAELCHVIGNDKLSQRRTTDKRRVLYRH